MAGPLAADTMDHIHDSLNPSAPQRWLPAPLLILCGVTAVALGFRLHSLDAESLWMDELVTVRTFYLPIEGVIAEAAVTTQPPLDNLVGAVLARLGFAGSDWWVRIPPVLFGTAGVFMLGWWVGRLAGATAGITAALLLAVCPLHVVMSQEVRPYAILFALALVTLIAFDRARSRGSKRSWVLFGVVLYFFLMTRWVAPHCIVAGLALYALGAFALSRKLADGAKRRAETLAFRRTVTVMGIVYVLYAPFFFFVLYGCPRAFNAATTDQLNRACILLLEAYKAIFSGYSFRTLFASLPASPWFMVVVSVLASVGLGVLLVRMCRQGDRGVGLLVAGTLPFPFLYALIFVNFTTALPKPQYLLLAAVPLLASIAVAIDVVRRKLEPVGSIVSWTSFAVLLGIVALPMTRTSLASLQTIDKRDWRGALNYVRDHSTPGDAAVSVASDVVPPTYTPIVFGRGRYGPPSVRFAPIHMNMPLEIFDESPWTTSDNTVWILAYTDRMYTGSDQVTPPDPPPCRGVSVHLFNGLFLIEIAGEAPAVDRLMDGLALLYDDLPDGRSLIAPAVVRGRYLNARGETDGARSSFDLAVRQCRSIEEAVRLTSDHITPLRLADGS